MASKSVRTTFRDTLQAAFPTTQYVESIATRVDNETLDSLWMSLEFINGDDRAISIGKPACYRETGTARVWIAAISGSGDDAAINLGDAVAAHYRGWSVMSPKIKALNVVSPGNNPESDGRWFLAYVDVNYQHDYTV